MDMAHVHYELKFKGIHFFKTTHTNFVYTHTVFANKMFHKMADISQNVDKPISILFSAVDNAFGRCQPAYESG